MVVVVAYWLVSRYWCRYPRNRWILHFRLDPFFLPNWRCYQERVSLLRCTYSALDTALSTKTTAFAGVLWVLEGFMRALKNESDEGHNARIIKTINSFKVFGAAGIYQCRMYQIGQESWSSSSSMQDFIWSMILIVVFFLYCFSSINCNVLTRIIGSHNAVIIRGWLHIGLRKTFFASTPRRLG